MASTSEAKKTPRDLVPPDESTWQRYSPHHEFPLSSLVSFFVHAFAIGLMLMIGLGWIQTPNFQPAPAVLDAVVVKDGSPNPGDAPESGGTPGSPSSSDNKTEIVPMSPKQEVVQPPMPMDIAQANPITVPEDLELDPSIPAEFAKLRKDAEEIVNKQPDPPKNPVPSTNSNAKPAANRVGTGGRGQSGVGTGDGNRNGPGSGKGGTPGIGTKQQVYARRWRFDLSGDAREHAEKLAAIGVTLAYSDATQKIRLISDLRQRPVTTSKEPFSKYKDAVTWYNTDKRSVSALAKELQLSGSPLFIAMLLPKDREEKMADAEAKFAQEKGKNPDTIQATWFDFRLIAGNLEPVVLKIE